MPPQKRAVNTTSENVPTADPHADLGSKLARVWLGIAGIVVALWLLGLGWSCRAAIANNVAAATRALQESPQQRIQRASGLGPEFMAAIRAAMPVDGRLVLYSPYGGSEFELDGSDPRGEPARQVRGLFERAKNLLYPSPRDVRFARDPEELLRHVDAKLVGRLVVVDGTQGEAELTVGGRYELLHTSAPGGPRMRVWRLRGGV